MTILAEMARLEAHNAVLRVLVRHPNLLERRAFEDLRGAIAALVPFRRLAILVSEGADQRRVHAIDTVHGTDEPLPFGARISGSTRVSNAVFIDQQPVVAVSAEYGQLCWWVLPPISIMFDA